MEHKILLVDDDAMLLFLHKSLLNRNGIKCPVFTFKNGKEALEYLELESCDCQYLMLLDINMPVMNGWELLDILKNKKIASYLDVVMVTSSIDQPDKDRAKTYNFVVDFVEKPMLKVDKVKGILREKE